MTYLRELFDRLAKALSGARSSGSGSVSAQPLDAPLAPTTETPANDVLAAEAPGLTTTAAE